MIELLEGRLMFRWRTRTFMVGIVFVAIDLANYRAMMANGSPIAIAIFLLMNGVAPVLLGLGLAIRRMRRDHTSSTIY